MLMKAASVVAMLAIVGILAVTVPTTVQLSRLDNGLSSSLASTGKLVTVEHAVITKNQSLGTLVKTAGDMEKNLETTKTVTSTLEHNIAIINALNKDTLLINQSIAQKSGVSAQNLQAIATNMQALNQSTAQLAATLSQLSTIVSQDEAALGQMRQATHAMDAKIPGVSG